MKSRGLPSPDDADALACTFSEMVMPTDSPFFYNPTGFGVVKDYDRYADIDAP